jgi:hypothetical protein
MGGGLVLCEYGPQRGLEDLTIDTEGAVVFGMPAATGRLQKKMKRGIK